MRKLSLLSALLLTVAALPAAGCTRILNDGSAIAITGTPPPPPEPEPEPEVKRVEITADAIVIHEKIEFEFGKATIRSVSHSLLNEVAQVITDNPQIQEVSIEGHTDDVGSDKSNQKLSENRAKAVREYLVGKGIADAKLTSVGYGESKPIDSNETDEGRARNRRVEFRITKQEPVKKTVEVDAQTGEPVAQ